MPQMIFVNLPVANVAKATAFYEAIGMVRNAEFSNEQASGATTNVSPSAACGIRLPHCHRPASVR